MKIWTYKAIDQFTNEEFPAISMKGVLYDSRTGERATSPMGIITIPITSEQHSAMCDALGLE